MGWLEDIQLNRRRQVEQMNKAFGNNLEKAYNKDDFSDDNSTKRDGKSNIYKMKVLGLRKFDGQDSKKYVGVENADGSYITNLDNGDIVVSLMDDGGYLVSKFPIGNDEDVDEREAADLDEALDIALMYKEDLEEETDDDDVMYQNTEKSDDDAEVYAEEETEKSFEDEVNPFELSAWEKEQEEIAKAYETLGLDYNIEKAHKDGDMHPNGKWVWRASANGGKGDWRVAKPGGSKATAYSKAR